ncbi:MAG TPA: glycoside hydrolase family 97 C-terminal domain-containing protein, partial [Chitinophagaceae bacterium]
GKDSWFLGAISDENARSFTESLSFLDADKKYLATIYRDADNADWKNNPEAYVIEKFLVDSKTNLKLKLAPGGGTAISLVPATADELKEVKKYK